MKRYNDLHNLARYLKTQFLPNTPVQIRRLRLENDRWGDCDFDGKKYKIRIDNRVSEQYAIFFLMHEYAHILAWDKQQKDHGTSWGIAMSKIYCAYLKWIDADEDQVAAACLRAFGNKTTQE